MELNRNWFWYGVAFLVGIYVFILGLVKTQVFFAPLATAMILVLVMLPLANKMEKSFLSRGWVSSLCTLLLFMMSLAFIALMLYQAKLFLADWPQLKDNLTPKWEQLKSFLSNTTPLNQSDFNGMENDYDPQSLKQKASSSGSITSIVGNVFSFFGNYLLTFIYVFFPLNYRHHFKKFLLDSFPDVKRKQVNNVIIECAQVAPRYLVGKAILIAILAVLYSIGLGVSGVENFILVSIMAALFSLIPYIGNIIGFVLAVTLGYASTGDSSVLIGILLTFVIAQFVESYLLEPYVVGDKVDLHPFFIIVVVIVGNLIWGIIGMIIFIPLLAILAVILVHIPSLKPLGKLLGGMKQDKKS